MGFLRDLRQAKREVYARIRSGLCPICNHAHHLDTCPDCGDACRYDDTMMAASERLQLAVGQAGVTLREAAENGARNLRGWRR